jgi:DNA-binding CsgD family transcriptional regulator
MLIGRETETAGLGQLLDAARLGTSGALVVRGEAGIGKTALLEQAAAMAGDFRVLRATGIESEAELPYATLHQLLRPLEDRIDQLAEPQALALRGALGLAHEREADRFLIGVGVLTLLADAAEEQPLLAVLDDAAWFDRSSADALGFVARRIEVEGIVLLFAVRDEPGLQFSLPGVAELRVQRLPDADARRLLGDGIDPGRRDEVLARARGNPLALIELGRPPVEGAIPATGAEQAFASRIAALPEDTQALLLLAAADTTQSLSVVGAAARELSLDPDALEPAELDGLILVAGGAIEFRHPLVRHAVYHTAPFARRARAHTALADVLAGEENADRRAWHHASAVLGADDDAAAELERTAGRARSRGGHAAASVALERAAELSSNAQARASRLVAAANASGMSGDPERAMRLVDRAGADLDDADAALAAFVRGSVTMARGTTGDAFEFFLQSVRAGSVAAPGTALNSAIRAIDAGLQANHEDRIPALRELIETIEPQTDDDRSGKAAALGLSAFMLEDFDAAFPALRRAAELAAASEDPLVLIHAAWAAAFAGDHPNAHVLVSKGERIARATGAVGALTVILMARAAWDIAASRFDAGEQAAAEGLTMARETGQPGMVAVHLSILARVDAVRGRADACRERAAEALSLARPRGLSHPASAAEYALALLDLGAGRAADAYARFLPIFTDGYSAYRYAAVDDLIEAAMRDGRPDRGVDALQAWERSFRVAGTPAGLIVAARARAMLAPPDEADAAFQECLAIHARAPFPFLQARTELSYGELLRRMRRKTEARVQLRAAFEGFQRLGAAAWADRAAAELRATGETARKRDISTVDDLTPQELQIARLAAEGSRNREIAGQLFLSPKTVEYHLRKVFQKLDIASRTELVRLVAGGEHELAGAAFRTLARD